MAENRRTDNNSASKVTALMSTVTAIEAAALLLKKPAQAAGSQFPPEVVELLMAIAANGDATLNKLDELVQALGNLSFGQGWPPQRNNIQAVRVQFLVAAQAVQFPDIAVPDGFTLQVIAWPNNANLIYVGESQSAATNLNQVVPLALGGNVGYHIKNANVLWGSAIAAGDSVTITCER